MFPCFHWFSRTSPTHLSTIYNIFLFRGYWWVLVLIGLCMIVTTLISKYNKTPSCFQSARLVISNECVSSSYIAYTLKKVIHQVFTIFMSFQLVPLLILWWQVTDDIVLPAQRVLSILLPNLPYQLRVQVTMIFFSLIQG